MNDKELKQLEDELAPSMNRYLTSAPKAEDTQSLILSLQDEFNELKAMGEMKKRPSFYTVFLNQFSTFQPSYWAVSVLIYVMLMIIISVEWSTYRDGMMVILNPIILLTGIVYSYQSWNKEMRMVEEVTPYPPALIFYSRMIYLLAFNLIFGVISRPFIHLFGQIHSGLLYSVAWSALSIFIIGLTSFFILWFGTKKGFSLTLILWFATVLLRSQFVIWFNEHLFLFYLGIMFVGILTMMMSYIKSQSVVRLS